MILFGLWVPPSVHAQNSECADVKIVIQQKASLERQAFDAHMEIRNGLTASVLTNVSIQLTYADQNQQSVVATTDPNAVGATFFQGAAQLSGISAINGSASLPAQTTATIDWLIIPSQGAGGNTANGQLYYIGATVTYTLDGQTTTVNVPPDYVVVMPQPLLVLDYFLPAEVYADDPFTPQVEPPVPFTLGVRVSNIGAGTSMATTIDSAQPQIVDNQQGLLIDFKILGSYVGNNPVGKSLLLSFGNIPGQQSAVGRWVMQTTLSGRFTDFTASFTHADTLGGAVTSLIQFVNTHTLIHDVLIDLAGHDDIPDFLAQAGTGERVYDSQGGDIAVIDISAQASLASLSGGNLHLTFNPTPNLVYAKVTDPYGGAKPIVQVVRSDGKIIPSQNFWLSKTQNNDHSWSYFINIFDSNSTGDYVLQFSSGGTTASLSGLAYYDANSNGIRDAGEAPVTNLAVTLKGVDNQGSNVLVTANTDSSGHFSFGDLTPGTYQLSAAAVNGWVDGTWASGSAGGLAQSGSITGIVLGAGTVAQGYLIGKVSPTVSPPPAAQADLSITLQAARAQLHGGDSTTVTAVVRNAGPATAQAVTAQAVVPAGLTLQSSSASTGSYAGGAWNIGDPTSGQEATLTLTVKANPVSGSKDVSITWPASVNSSTADPQMANNSTSLGLTVLADQTNTIELTDTLPAYADVLMLVSCPTEAPADQAACETAASTQAQAVLGSRVRQLQVVSELNIWRTAVRSGAYNVLWLHGGAGKLDAQQLQELRAAVVRGASLVVDGQAVAEVSGAPMTAQLADVLGAAIQLPALGSDQAVLVPNQPSAQATVGPLYALGNLAGSTYVMATASGSQPVMVNHPYGLGQTWLTGFDLLQTGDGSAGAFWDGFLTQQLRAISPAGNASPALGGSSLTVQATARSNAALTDPAQSVILSMAVPSGVTWQSAIPAPSLTQAQQVQWTMQLASAQSGSGQITLQLPRTTTTLQLQMSALDGTTQQLLTSQTLPIQVLGLDTLTPQIAQELANLSGATPDMQVLITQAGQDQATAQAAQAASPPDWDATLTALADLQATLMRLTQPPYSLNLDTLPLDVARWIALAQSNWQAGTTPGTTPTAAQVLVQAGGGQSTTVSTAFAAPLVAQVLDALGAPIAGVAVHFQLPASGASALFAGGSFNADITTDAQGQAQSPALTANATAGSYQATASVAGLTQTVSFNLTNAASGGSPSVPASLRLISGTAQGAQIGTAFAAPIVVQVLDASNQPVPGVNVTIAFAASGASATFTGGQSSVTLVTDSQGTVTSPVFTANGVVGSYQAKVTVSGVSGALGIGLANVALAPTLGLQLIQGDGQSAPVSQAYAQAISVRVVDAHNNPRPGATVLFSMPASGPSASFGGGQLIASVVTGADGVAVSPVPVANGVQGSFTALAATDGAAQPVLVHLTNLPPAGSGTQFQGTVAVGSGIMTAQVSGGGDSCVFNRTATRLIAPTGIWTPSLSFRLPYGLFEFELVGCDIGSQVTVTTTWPDLSGFTGYLKYGPTPASGGQNTWYVPSNMRIQGNTVTFTLRDGALGDDDLNPNGVIRDGGGPIMGAFAGQAIPTLGAWTLLLLVALLGLNAMYAHRRRV